jgi:hypothetical protein
MALGADFEQNASTDTTSLPPGMETGAVDYGQQPGLSAYEGANRESTGELERLQRTDKWDKFKALWQQNVMQSPIGSYDQEGSLVRSFAESNLSAQYDAQSMGKMSKEEAIKKYPGIPIEGPEYEPILQLRYDQKQKADMIARQVESGPNTSFLFDAGVGLAQGAVDPLNWLLGSVSKAAFGAYGLAGKIFAGELEGQAAAQAMKAVPLVKKIPAIYAQNYAENLGLMAATVPQNRREGGDETYWSAAASALTGAAIGTGLHLTVDAIKSRIEKAKLNADIRAKVNEMVAKGMPAESREKVVSHMVAQAESGVKIDSRAALDEAQMRMAGEVKPGTEDTYNFKPFTQPDGREFFTVTDAKDGSVGNLGHNVGDNVVIATDRPQAARNQGDAHALAIHEDTRFVDLDTPVTDEGPSSTALHSAIDGVLSDDPALAPFKEDLHASLVNEHETWKQAIETIAAAQEAGHIPEDTLTKIQDKLAAAGVDGYNMTHTVDGVVKHNVIALFNHDKATSTGFIPYDPSIVPTRSMADVAAGLTDPKNMFGSSDQVDKDIKEAQVRSAPDETDRMQKLKQEEAQSLATIKQMAEGIHSQATDGTAAPEKASNTQKRLNDIIEKETSRIDKEHAEELDENKALKALADCTYKGMM